jgi:protein O-mannosyl-transferase
MSRRAKKHPVPDARRNERQDRSSTRRSTWDGWPVTLAVCCLLVLATLFVFGQTLGHTFINYDDNEYVYQNPQVEHGFATGWVAWAFTSRQCYNWHPLTWFSHTLDAQLFNLNASWHHATNVLLHAAAAVALFLVLRQMTGDRWSSGFAAAVFAVHPLHVESVAWVAERKDVLSGLLFMLTLAAYVGYARRPFAWGRYLAVIACFALGLTAKPMLVTLPFVLLLLDYWPLGRLTVGPAGTADSPAGTADSQGGTAGLSSSVPGVAKQATLPSNTAGQASSATRRVLVEKIPLLLLSAASCAVTVWAQQEAIKAGDYVPLSARLANAAVSYVTYLVEMFWPADLAVIYPHRGSALPLWQVAASVAILAAITAGAVVLRRKCPYLLVGWLWCLGMLVPVIGLVQVGKQAMADRYTYLPQIGLYVAVVWGIAQLAQSWRHRGLVCGTAAALTLGALTIAAREQASYWRNSQTLFSHAVACTSDNAIAGCQLGIALFDQGDTDKAIEQFEKALAVQPNPDPVKILSNLGDALIKQNRCDEAIDRCKEALKLDPGYANAHYNLGLALRLRGRLDEAIDHFQESLRLQPGCADAHNSLGVAFAQKRMFAKAIDQFQKAVDIAPAWADARRNLGMALTDNRQFAAAMQQYQTALAIAVQQGNRTLAEAIKDKIETCQQLQSPR